jgi:hypothetical protein
MACDDVRDLAPGYVLDALEPAEAAAVREHLATCPNPHPEFAELGGVVPYLAESAALDPVEPPAALRDRIMAAAAADLEARGEASPAAPVAAPPAATPRAAAPPVAAATPAAAAPILLPSAELRAVPRAGPGPFDWALRIAAVVAIVALAGWNLLLQGQLGAARQYEDAVAAVVEAAGEPGSQTVILTPAEGEARGLAAVRPDGSVVLAVRNLAATSGSQVYETWVIVGESAPVALGSFTVGADGTGTITTRPAETPPGAVIALTLEPNPGNTTPVGPIVASGVAVAPTS